MIGDYIMTGVEQTNHCEVCEFHKIIQCTGGINIMSCHCGDYKNRPVWGDFQCPLGDKKPIRQTNEDEFVF
jgi:hypothetical protein